MTYAAPCCFRCCRVGTSILAPGSALGGPRGTIGLTHVQNVVWEIDGYCWEILQGVLLISNELPSPVDLNYARWVSVSTIPVRSIDELWMISYQITLAERPLVLLTCAQHELFSPYGP